MLRAALTSALHGPAPQATHWKTAWLLRFSGAMCPQWEHRCDVYAAGTNSSRPWALCFKPGDQQSPPLAADLAVEAAFLRDVTPRTVTSPARGAGHRTHTQILDADGVEAARQIGGGLFHPVTAAIGFAGAHPGNGPLRSRSPMRSALRPGQTLLQSAESLGFTSTKARNAQQLSAGQRNRYGHAAIHTHNAAVAGSRDRVGDGSKRDVPAPRSIQS